MNRTEPETPLQRLKRRVAIGSAFEDWYSAWRDHDAGAELRALDVLARVVREHQGEDGR